MLEDSELTIAVLSNDSDPDGDLLAVEAVGQASNGNVRRNGNVVIYTPGANFTGTDSFIYTVRDNNGLVDTATVIVTVQPVNDAPVANDDSATVIEEGQVTISVISNDVDVDGDELKITAIVAPANGNVTQDGQSITYVPNINFNGNDSFIYTISDGTVTDVATVNINVTRVNDSPVATDDSITIPEDAASTTIDVLVNDVDPDNDVLTIVSAEGAVNGTLTRENGQLVYAPNGNFNGSESIVYTVSDGAQTDTATLTVVVEAVNDAPVAMGDSSTTAEDTAIVINVLANDRDVDGDSLTISTVSSAANGTVVNNVNSIAYIPNGDFFGPDSFTYVIKDTSGLTAQAQVTVRVTAANDAPEGSDDSATTAEDNSVTVDVLANDSDVDGDVITVIEVSEPVNGVATIEDDRIKYVPDANFFGEDKVTYTIYDGSESATALLSLTVTSENDAPRATNDVITTAEEESGQVNLLANDSDVDGDALVVKAITQPANGSATLDGAVLTYVPLPNFSGTDELRYTVTDGKVDVEATVRINVSATNDAPSAADDSATGVEDTAITIDVLTNDSDRDTDDTLAIVSVSTPEHGTAEIVDNSIRYLPNRNYSGTDSFTYEIEDSGNLRDSATVSVEISEVNDAPVANDDSALVDEDSTVIINVLTNDVDPDDSVLTVEIIAEPSNGSASVNADGTITYAPDADYDLADTFRYRITDAGDNAENRLSDEATVTISITSINDAPVAEDDSATVDEDGSVAIDVLNNDSDVDNDALSIAVASEPANGTARIVDNSIIYTPSADSDEDDSFTYTLSDGIREDTATVTIEVIAQNDVPEANDDNVDVNEDETVTIDVLDNDSDVEEDALDVVIEEEPEHGQVIVENDYRITYTPNAEYEGTDSFVYRISEKDRPEAERLSDTAMVTVEVNPVDDEPEAEDDSASTNEDEPVTIDVLNNDNDPDSDSLSVTVIQSPRNGSAQVNEDNSITYTPTPDYADESGPDAFTYQVSDGNSSDTATVEVSVQPVNDAPTAEDDTLDVDEDNTAQVDVLNNDEDVDDDPLTVSIVVEPENGTVTITADGSIVYQPDPDYFGADSFSYSISDGELFDEATVEVTVLNQNDAPSAVNDSAETTVGESVTVDVLANDVDVDGDELTVSVSGEPSYGSFEVSGNAITYTPSLDFEGGTDEITYTVTDGFAYSVAILSITVNAAEPAP